MKNKHQTGTATFDHPRYLDSDRLKAAIVLTATMAFFISACIAAGAWSYMIRKRSLMTEMDQRLRLGATAVSQILPVDFHDRATQTNTISALEDRNNIRRLSEYANANGFAFLYTLIATPEGMVITASSATAKELATGTEVTYFEAFPEAYHEFFVAAEESRIISFTHSDRWGVFRATAVPGKSPSGRNYLNVAEYEISDVRSALRDTLMTDLTVWTLLMLAALPMVFVVVRRAHRLEAQRTELLEQEEEASRIEAMGRLAGGVAHDFNNLLTGILGYVSIMKDEISDDHPIRPYLDNIENDAMRTTGLTRQLLAFARRQTAEPELLQLSLVIKSLQPLLSGLIGENIDIYWSLTNDVWGVRMDPTQVEQIVVNLCVNARDAIGDVGTITIETSNVELDASFCAHHPQATPGDYAMLAISDTGCGMDEDMIEHIFEPFYTSKEVGRGTGLGLATVYGIIRQNGGYVSVCSKSGSGTTFRIYLPRFLGMQDTPETTYSSLSPLTGNETILLAEDEPSIRITTAHFLGASGYTVLDAESPEIACRISEEHNGQLDMLITDIVMPGMGGKELAQQVARRYPGIKTLYMSGYTADHIAQNGIVDADINFISKPFNRDQLLQKVREVLDRPDITG